MGGFFGAAAEHNCISDVFFGTDYHSHLGTRRGGMTAYSPEKGFQRSIHSIENSPFRTKFESDVDAMEGNLCIGSISDTDPQPILLKSRLGTYAVCNIGIINNAEELCNELLSNSSASFEAMSSGKVNSSTLIGGLIAQRDNIVEVCSGKDQGHNVPAYPDRGRYHRCPGQERQASYYNRKARRRILCFL